MVDHSMLLRFWYSKKYRVAIATKLKMVIPIISHSKRTEWRLSWSGNIKDTYQNAIIRISITMIIWINLLLQRSSSSRSSLFVFPCKDGLLLIDDEYLLPDILDTVLMELFRLSPLFSFASRLFILSNWSILVSKLSVTCKQTRLSNLLQDYCTYYINMRYRILQNS